MDEWTHERHQMVADQIQPRNIHDQRVLSAMARVPRHLFVPPDLRMHAYDDGALPIAEGQTISQPYIVALMAAALQLHGAERVLEIGTGSGYAAAILATLAADVITIERHPLLAQTAAKLIEELGYPNITVVEGDGSLGWPAAAPYAAISVPAGAPDVPPVLLKQLADGGRLVIPVGPSEEQRLLRFVRQGAQFSRDDLGPVRFVPLIGAAGWSYHHHSAQTDWRG